MASLIAGFEYDIFISYRQKDNKGDRWVSEFVEALKIELESTFKEEIRVYFDINPHDGLLETDDVDASLSEKLKCLIFIPVISRTYCDPKSFAWQHEFMAFIDSASTDRFGLKVNLPNGNVSGRILPVRIHELEEDDIKLCETALGGVIRGVDFVYREAGVNRPLTPLDDEKKNLNNTRYRNQINKTANAIKEIISGLKLKNGYHVKNKSHKRELWKEIEPEIYDEQSAGRISKPLTRNRIIIMLLVILCILGAFEGYRILKHAKSNKTIGVYFSPEIKNDTVLKNICIIYTETLHSKLCKVKALAVRPRVDIYQYDNLDKPLSALRKDLNADYILLGNLRRNGNNIIIWVELSSEKDKKDLWSESYTWDKNLISGNTTEIVNEIARNLKTKITTGELNDIKTEPSQNAEANMNYTYANAISYNAYTTFITGNQYFESINFRSAIQTYDKAIKDDPLFAEAYARRAIARAWGYYTGQLDSTNIQKCLDDINKATNINNNLSEIQIASGFYYYYCTKELARAIEYFSNAIEKSPGDFQPLFYLAMVYRRMGNWNKCQTLIKKLISLDPQDAICLTNIGLTYGYFHKYDSALIFHQKAIDVMPGWPYSYKNKIETLILKNSNISEARMVVDTAISKTGKNFLDFIILLDIYDRKYTRALTEAQKSKPADFDYGGIRYLMLAYINSYTNHAELAVPYYDSALVNFKNYLNINKNNFRIHSYIGIAFAGLKDYTNAVAEGKKAVDLVKYTNFDKSDMILNLARIYTMSGQYDKAIATIGYLMESELNIPSNFSMKLMKHDPVWEPLLTRPEMKEIQRKYLEKI